MAQHLKQTGQVHRRRRCNPEQQPHVVNKLLYAHGFGAREDFGKGNGGRGLEVALFTLQGSGQHQVVQHRRHQQNHPTDSGVGHGNPGSLGVNLGGQARDMGAAWDAQQTFSALP